MPLTEEQRARLEAFLADHQLPFYEKWLHPGDLKALKALWVSHEELEAMVERQRDLLARLLHEYEDEVGVCFPPSVAAEVKEHLGLPLMRGAAIGVSREESQTTGEE